jgi:putative transposase
MSARERCRRHTISDATFYTWRKKFGGMEVPEVTMTGQSAPVGFLLAIGYRLRCNPHP